MMMYACGYVPVALIHRYDKRAGSKYALFVQCLLHNNIMITVHFTVHIELVDTNKTKCARFI